MSKRRNKDNVSHEKINDGVIHLFETPVKDSSEKKQVGSKKDVIQAKSHKRKIAREIADDLGIYGTAFGRNMLEHHKQGR